MLYNDLQKLNVIIRLIFIRANLPNSEAYQEHYCFIKRNYRYYCQISSLLGSIVKSKLRSISSKIIINGKNK